ncbi:hypothetical protein [Streptomyces sp. Wh19]|uniref:hypothetical protein n=1 Tax=Streptomyces sp. Wh19 TaxID=3076629 RepID=UPI002958D0CC|nr:hypothetical protein [Streptomyces sp. Wh19]MDV9195242.1 hypothetical protein [Streptomyces sp. Wh19]
MKSPADVVADVAVSVRAAHTHGHDEFLGTAYSDHDLVVFLEAAGIHDPDAMLDDPRRIEWRGGHAHEWNAT